MRIHPEWLRHDLRDLASIIAIAALTKNFLPYTEDVDRWLARWPRTQAWFHDVYIWIVDMVSIVALSIRSDQPSLSVDFNFFWFGRRIKHRVRNWQQDRLDRQYAERTKAK